MSFISSSLLIDWLLFGVADILQRGGLRYATVFAVSSLVVLSAALEAMAFLLPPIHLILWYKVSVVTTGLLLLL